MFDGNKVLYGKKDAKVFDGAAGNRSPSAAHTNVLCRLGGGMMFAPFSLYGTNNAICYFPSSK